MAINTRVVLDRCTQLGVSEDEFAEATGVRITQIEQGMKPESVSLALLTRIADVLRLPPSDLVVDSHPTLGWDRADVLLLEFALANAPQHQAQLPNLLGWSAYRVAATVGAVRMYPTSSAHAVETLDDDRLALGPAPHSSAARDHEEYGQWLSQRTAPDPFDAVALLHILQARLQAPAGEPVAFASSDAVRRLSDRHLAVAAAGSAPATLLECGFDTPLALHPDLLFALDLGGPPADVQ